MMNLKISTTSRLLRKLFEFVLLVLKDILEKHLEKQIPIVAVVAVMGTTEESSIDPLTEIVTLRKQFSKKVS